jgi:hypothetical protein
MRIKFVELLFILAVQGFAAGGAFAADPVTQSALNKTEELRRQAHDAEPAKHPEDFRYWGEKTGGAPAATGLEDVDRVVQAKSYAQGLKGGVEKDVGSTTVGAAVTAGTGEGASKALKPENYSYQGVTVYQKARDAATGTSVDMSASYVSGNATQGAAAGKTEVYSVGSQVSARVYDGFVKVEPFVGASVNRIERTGAAAENSGTAAEVPLGINVTGSPSSAGGFSVTPRATMSAAPLLGDEKVTGGESMHYRTGVGVTARKDDFSLDLEAQKETGGVEKSDSTIMLRAKQRF